MGIACSVLNGHFGPVYLPQVSKNDDEEHCFSKQFGFISNKKFHMEVYGKDEKKNNLFTFLAKI